MNQNSCLSVACTDAHPTEAHEWLRQSLTSVAHFLSPFLVLYDKKLQQMEGSLEDPETLRRLLNDKQNDLELAAQIGKSLLDRNRELDRQLRDSEQQMAAAMETINQLEHSLGMKEELLQMWNEHSANEEDMPSDDTSHGDFEVSRLHCRSEISG
ncbi:unnamed protein product [Hydatigera taeniaeformis]|uniref:HAP1 N-terminal domain-containing protein n=1 Tax=Hydatigena taeniaeformis TaxID=6205 RepID=A0A0R3XA81_HYDTA|nr:unnamed protein product [Hydatigera taeniaeformis]